MSLLNRRLEGLRERQDPIEGSQDSAAWHLEPPVNTRLRKDPFATEDWRSEANLGADPKDLAGH